MWQVRVLLIIASLFSFSAHAQQLIINEVSQGTGAKEYVEFVVIGTPTCQAPVPCIDLRGVIIDDNNGYFAAGSGTGIASGAIRFANTTFWSCVPQGTYIVVYNELDVNPALPPADLDLNDGNCRLVIPANSSLLEGQSVSPNNGDPTYPSGGWVAGSGTWNQVAMSNSNDSFQIPNLGVNGTPLHGVSWGNNTNGSIIYFSGAAGSKVFSFMNGTSNDWNLQANWASGNVGTDETPGAPNSPENDAWIASMNPQCGISAGLNAVVQTTPISCGSSCSGTAIVQVSNGTAPYTYAWLTGETTASLSNLCPGTYTVTVTDAGGCSISAQGTVQNSGGSNLLLNFSTTPESCFGNCDASASITVTGGTQPYQYAWSNGVFTASNPNICPGTYSVGIVDQNGCTGNASIVVAAGPGTVDATILPAGPFMTTDAPYQLQSATTGGTWLTADCASCLTTDGIFDPETAGAGTFQICYTVGNGACSANDCLTITVSEGCVPQETEENILFCPGDSVLVFGNWEVTAGIYSQTFTDISGCDSLHSVVLTACEIGDLSVFVPNTFTPNGDNINDLFRVELLGAQLDEGYVFNRWGNTIKEFGPNDLTWDGRTSSGDLVQDGVYTYMLYYTPVNGNKQTIHGFVTVIR